MKYYLLFLAGLICFFAACKGHDDPGPVSIGGKGGNGTLHITPRHHGRQIDSCIIYIKYNATDTPANNQYDDSMRCAPVAGIPVAVFSGLKKGNYFLYGYGWDPTLTPPKHVMGAFAYPLTAETDQNIDLAVSEGD